MANVAMVLLREPTRGEAEVVARGLPVSRRDAFATEENTERLAAGNEATFRLRNRRDIRNGWRLLDSWGDQWEVTGITRPASPGGFMELDARRTKAVPLAQGTDPFAGFEVLGLGEVVLVNNEVAIGIAE